jgi:hypothetical protein
MTIIVFFLISGSTDLIIISAQTYWQAKYWIISVLALFFLSLMSVWEPGTAPFFLTNSYECWKHSIYTQNLPDR